MGLKRPRWCLFPRARCCSLGVAHRHDRGSPRGAVIRCRPPCPNVCPPHHSYCLPRATDAPCAWTPALLSPTPAVHPYPLPLPGCPDCRCPRRGSLAAAGGLQTTEPPAASAAACRRASCEAQGSATPHGDPVPQLVTPPADCPVASPFSAARVPQCPLAARGRAGQDRGGSTDGAWEPLALLRSGRACAELHIPVPEGLACPHIPVGCRRAGSIRGQGGRCCTGAASKTEEGEPVACAAKGCRPPPSPARRARVPSGLSSGAAGDSPRVESRLGQARVGAGCPG